MGGESEKEGFAFPRTKTFITAIGALDPLPAPLALLALTSSLREPGIPVRHETHSFPLPVLFLSSYPPAPPLSLRAVRLFVLSSQTRFSPISFSLCPASLILLHLAPS